MRHIRPYWVPLTIVAVLLTGVLVAMPWYFKTYRGATPDRGLTPEEIEWAAAYAPWRGRLGSTASEAYRLRVSLDDDLGRVLEEADGCEEELRDQVGQPPTERLGLTMERAAAACSMAGAARAEYRAAGDAPNWRTSQTLLAATGALDEADLQLRRLMLAQRPLPTAAGRRGESRIEPAFGRAVSVEQPPEVVCWSDDEWPQVRAELSAVGSERDAELRREVNAYRYRVHASPRVCEQLERVAYPDEDETPVAAEELATALLAVLHASGHAVGGVEDEDEAWCAAVAEARAAAVRLGAARWLAVEVARAAHEPSRCPS